MSARMVLVLNCGHTKVVVTKKIGDTFGSGDKVFCMDCAKKSKIVTIRF